MFIGRVIGNIVSTAKRDELQAAKLFIVEVYNDKLEPTGKYEVSFDAIGIGLGDYVLVCGGSAARMPETTSKMPADSSIMARIDDFKKLKKEFEEV